MYYNLSWKYKKVGKIIYRYNKSLKRTTTSKITMGYSSHFIESKWCNLCFIQLKNKSCCFFCRKEDASHPMSTESRTNNSPIDFLNYWNPKFRGCKNCTTISRSPLTLKCASSVSNGQCPSTVRTIEPSIVTRNSPETSSISAFTE